MEPLTMLDQVAERLRVEGGRMTIQRRFVLEALEELPGHPSAEDIYARAREQDSTLNLSTVYRTLRWLEDSGFVTPRWFAEGRRTDRYDRLLQGEPQTSHHHFVCRICGTVIEFVDPLIDSLAGNYQHQHGGTVEESTLTLFGICLNCDQNDLLREPKDSLSQG